MIAVSGDIIKNFTIVSRGRRVDNWPEPSYSYWQER